MATHTAKDIQDWCRLGISHVVDTGHTDLVWAAVAHLFSNPRVYSLGCQTCQEVFELPRVAVELDTSNDGAILRECLKTEPGREKLLASLIQEGKKRAEDTARTLHIEVGLDGQSTKVYWKSERVTTIRSIHFDVARATKTNLVIEWLPEENMDKQAQRQRAEILKWLASQKPDEPQSVWARLLSESL